MRKISFETKENALRFDSQLRNETITINSLMNDLTVDIVVSEIINAPLGKRIYSSDYKPTDFDTQEWPSFQHLKQKATNSIIKELRNYPYLGIWAEQKNVI
jgi:hypothetical protein